MMDSEKLNSRPSKWSFHILVVLLWAVTCAILLAAAGSKSYPFGLHDPDDYLRLVEVRDWIAGQSWFDVNQHRFNPPFGGSMHWSRLVDLPIALGIVLLTPLLGTQAEAVVLATVPLFYLGIVMGTIALVARHLMGDKGGLLAALLVALSPMLLVQLQPMRIDHHAAQITMAGLTLLALAHPTRGINMILAGVATALWMHISIEALPYAIFIGGLLGFAYIWQRKEGAAYWRYIVGLTGGSILFYLVTHPVSDWGVAYCDSISPAYLLPLVVLLGLFLGGWWIPAMEARIGRALLLAAAGGGALLTLVFINPDCLRGPFDQLDPLVHYFWYINIREGLPIWFQLPQEAIGLVWPPILGGVGAWLGLRRAVEVDNVRAWAIVAALNGGALLVALFVFRAASVAHLFALPGCAFLVLAALRRIGSIQMALPRAILTASIIGVVSPLAPMLAAGALVSTNDGRAESTASEGETCYSEASLRHLASLPPSRLLAPLDIGPAILATTKHSVMASGYHRNNAAMKQVILAFTQHPRLAHEYLRRHDLDYVVYCKGMSEIGRYIQRAPNGFLARLDRGETLAWLTPVYVRGPNSLRVWRLNGPNSQMPAPNRVEILRD